MRVNIYAEEMTNRVEIISKKTDEGEFTGLRFYLELPVTIPNREGAMGTENVAGPFMHRIGDDDSAAVTFWGKRDLRDILTKAIEQLDWHYAVEDKQASEQLPLDRNFIGGQTEQAQ